MVAKVDKVEGDIPYREGDRPPPQELGREQLCQAPKTHSVVSAPPPSFQRIPEVKIIFTVKGYCLFHKSPRGHVCSGDIIMRTLKCFTNVSVFFLNFTLVKCFLEIGFHIAVYLL